MRPFPIVRRFLFSFVTCYNFILYLLLYYYEARTKKRIFQDRITITKRHRKKTKNRKKLMQYKRGVASE